MTSVPWEHGQVNITQEEAGKDECNTWWLLKFTDCLGFLIHEDVLLRKGCGEEILIKC